MLILTGWIVSIAHPEVHTVVHLALQVPRFNKLGKMRRSGIGCLDDVKSQKVEFTGHLHECTYYDAE
jgi:hypothetical protein